MGLQRSKYQNSRKEGKDNLEYIDIQSESIEL